MRLSTFTSKKETYASSPSGPSLADTLTLLAITLTGMAFQRAGPTISSAPIGYGSSAIISYAYLPPPPPATRCVATSAPTKAGPVADNETTGMYVKIAMGMTILVVA
ncbi:hypothetical protein C0991_006609, partial [Blastosporella zonata]